MSRRHFGIDMTDATLEVIDLDHDQEQFEEIREGWR